MHFLKVKIKKYRFVIFYILSFIIALSFGYWIDKQGINEDLINYYDFIGDILNFSSILTGFLGAVISILTTISKSSAIINRILSSGKAFRQFILCTAIPFVSGIITIVWSMLFRLKLENPGILIFTNHFNILLITFTLFFIFSSVLMTVTIFYIFFRSDEKNNIKKKYVYSPELKKK